MNGKGTDTFKTAIQNYLEYRAATDELFAPLFANPNKSIDECCKYIICEVHKSGMNGFDDDEIFGMAVHTSTQMFFESTEVHSSENIRTEIRRYRATILIGIIAMSFNHVLLSVFDRQAVD